MNSSCCCFSHSALSAGLICVTCALSSSNSVLSRSIVVQLEPKNARTSSANSVPRVFIRTHLLSSLFAHLERNQCTLALIRCGRLKKYPCCNKCVPDHHRASR